MSRRAPRLVTRLMTAQVVVIAVGALALIAAAVLVAPGLFHYHLAQTGETDPLVQHHAEEAFATSFAIALLIATLLSLIAAGAVSWFLVRRVAHPVEELADAAETLASGSFDVDVPDAAFSSEISRLTDAFEGMATKLADNETTRRQLLSDLAHELRTPLATLEAGDLREAALAEEHALGIHLQPEDARDIVRAAVAAAAPRYDQAGRTLTVAVPEKEVTVSADSVRLQQVLANLLDNALRHTRTRVDVTLAVDAGAAVIRVLDDGDGIPADQLDAVFHRFHRVDPSRRAGDGSGSGLGLTIARAIVGEHGGTLTASSRGAGTGATFTVTLPLSA